MIDEINKSISSILYERVSSPLYGALAVSWAAWNWEIIFLTLFVKESNIDINKIEYIHNNFSDFNILVTYPLISAFLILTVVPFLSNGAYWLHIRFHKWKSDEKHKIEMKRLLTLEQSIQLREELIKAEEKLEKLLENKNTEINQLTTQIKVLQSKEKPQIDKKVSNSNKIELSSILEIVNKITNSQELSKSFENTVKFIQAGYIGLVESDGVTSTAIAFFEANHLIKSAGGGMYSLTDLGRDVLRELLDKGYE